MRDYLKIENLSKSYDDKAFSLKELSINIKKGEFVAIVGPSGSGKSTLLDLICGFISPDTGSISLANKDLANILPKDRDVAMVFQNYALLPHLTVAENIGFGLQIRKVKKAERFKAVKETAKLLGLEDQLEKLPKELSGGQKQRVALGRAIIREPKLFLMDEPLSNLDPALKDRTGQEIIDLHRKLGATTLYVTHSQEEAMLMADRIIVMEAGEIHQIAKPIDIYQKPADLFVATFIGRPKINLLRGIVVDGGIVVDDLQVGKTNIQEQRSVIIGIRPESLSIRPFRENDQSGFWITKIDYLGQDSLYYLKNARESEVVVRSQGTPKYQISEQVSLDYQQAQGVIFDELTKKRIGGL